ncbi:hypothetical protein EOL70_10705 [Leucothrix sargassi]|nr:hypothetical protein EOL70_10705 [Leucothrix sargassi]
MKHNKQTLCIALSCALFSTTLSADTSVGAYVNNDGWSLTTIDQFNADTARNATTINLFSTFSSDWDYLSQPASNIVSRSATPIITWMPYDNGTGDTDVLAQITSGERDAYIDNWIEGFINWRNSYPADQQPSIMLRFGHEFNGNWYPWGNQPEALVAAWKHLHQRFTAAGINDHVSWIWCANNVDVDDHSDISLYYPGDAYVDWLSLDGYNWGSNYSFTRWKSFDETFSQQYVKMVNSFPNKPIMLAEVGSAEPHDVPDSTWGQDGDDSDVAESKDAWVADMMQSIENNYPAIKSIVWFNTNKELSWALNLDGNTGLSAYNNAVMGDYFGGTPAIKPSATDAPTETPEEVPKRNKGKGKSRTADSGTKLTGLANAISRVPDVVGQKLLAREAQGLREMDTDSLKAWRFKRFEE